MGSKTQMAMNQSGKCGIIFILRIYTDSLSESSDRLSQGFPETVLPIPPLFLLPGFSAAWLYLSEIPRAYYCLIVKISG